ncbi:MAG: hypothetical protein Ct9H90mP20_1550 [Candidatus Neomarinimicrobiota bacterium]|nr:MAG: hypothetical protein Ct9H90mP20_1550 [Candidatus Neomarinimicrobiota bacterium]
MAGLKQKTITESLSISSANSPDTNFTIKLNEPRAKNYR